MKKHATLIGLYNNKDQIPLTSYLVDSPFSAFLCDECRQSPSLAVLHDDIEGGVGSVDDAVVGSELCWGVSALGEC